MRVVPVHGRRRAVRTRVVDGHEAARTVYMYSHICCVSKRKH